MAKKASMTGSRGERDSKQRTSRAGRSKKSTRKTGAPSGKAASTTTATRSKAATKPASGAKKKSTNAAASAKSKATSADSAKKKAPTKSSPTPTKSRERSPQTKSPQTKSPQTKSPQTKSPQTKSPQTKSPRAKAPKPKSEAGTPSDNGQRKSSGEPAKSKSKSSQRPERKPTTLGAARDAATRLAAAAGLGPPTQRSISAPIADSPKKRLKRSPLKPEVLEEFRRILVIKRAEVLGDVTEMEQEALGSRSGSLSSFPQHLADQGSDEYDQSLALGIAASQRRLLAEIDAALDRIENGTFGVCDLLGTPISRERLDATPWARHSLEGARQLDQHGSR